jgi:hypothetical protein
LDSSPSSEVGLMKTLLLTSTTEVCRRFEPVLRSCGRGLGGDTEAHGR